MTRLKIALFFLITLIVLVIILSIYIAKNTLVTIMPYSKFLKDYSPQDHNKALYVFYHICTAGPKWENIVEEQINDIIQSGLYEKATAIYYGCNCSKCDIILRDKFQGLSKIRPLEKGLHPDTPTHENQTLNAMITKARSGEADGYYLYIHSKGTTDKYPAQHIWRKFMMHWCVYNHQACIQVLDRGFYTVGNFFGFGLPGSSESHYLARLGYHHHYSGNFFWTTSDFVKKQPYITNLKNRYSAEIFILKHLEPNKHVAFTREKLQAQFNKQGEFIVTGITNVDKYITHQYNINDIPVSIL